MNQQKISDVTFHYDTLSRIGDRGDNWCLTWGADDSQIVSMDDGVWISSPYKMLHNHLYRITGEADNFTIADIAGYPLYIPGNGGWFGYGILSVDGVLYSAVSKTPGVAWSGPFTGVKLLKSTDNGQSWSRIDPQGELRLLTPDDPARLVDCDEEMFVTGEFSRAHHQQTALPFSFFDFVQCGQDNSAAKDDYTYIYSPEGAQAHQLLLARVPKHEIGIQRAWQYFTGYNAGEPQWSSSIQERQPVHLFPEKNQDGHYFGWYSWLPSVVWNEGLQLYIMVNGGTYAGYGMTDSDEDYYDQWMHTKTGSLGFWYSEHPYGPWQQFFYTDYWVADHPDNLTYQPKLSPKWISDCGHKMVLIWSDSMKDESGKAHTVNYKWNQIEITLQ